MAAKLLREQTYLILVALAGQPLHGYGIILAVGELSSGRTKLGPGTLYGALDRLVTEGAVAPDHDEVVDGRLRRYYRLTDQGHKVVGDETIRLAALAAKVTERLRGAPGLLPGAGAIA